MTTADWFLLALAAFFIVVLFPAISRQQSDADQYSAIIAPFDAHTQAWSRAHR